MKISHRFETTLGYLLVCLLSFIFLYAGLAKVADPADFAEDVSHYRMLPESWNAFLAASLPWLEILTGMGLLISSFRVTASVIATVLMAVFSAAIAIALARGLDVRCGCFGKEFAQYGASGVNFLLRDLVLLLLSGILLWLSLRQECRGERGNALSVS